jgi:hypothetical protein
MTSVKPKAACVPLASIPDRQDFALVLGERLAGWCVALHLNAT